MTPPRLDPGPRALAGEPPASGGTGGPRRRESSARRGAEAGAPGAARRRDRIRLIAIGASTGGVEALLALLSRFPADCPPTVVVQHMPRFFTRGFAQRLDALSPPNVREAWDGAPLERGRVYVAPGGGDHLEVVWGARREARLVPAPSVNRHRPSVDVAFESVARAVGRGAVGVLLTGMGRDGARGLLAMRSAGARTYAQDQESCAVYGMPRAALEIGAVDVGTPIDEIAKAIFGETDQEKERLEWP